MPLPDDRRLIKSLGGATEYLIVLIVAFGQFAYQSSIYALYLWRYPQSAAGHTVFTDAELLQLMAGELIVGGCLILFLRVRGWTADRYGLSITWLGTAIGLAIGVAAYLMSVGAMMADWYLVSAMSSGGTATLPLTQSGLTLPAVAMASAVNGTYEELFLCGYLIGAQCPRRWQGHAAAASMLVRLSYHTYQGQMGLINILVVGSLLTGYFVWSRRLWPMIVAHASLDIVTLLGLQ